MRQPHHLAACPRKAIYKRNEDGIVLVDQSRCRGYQEVRQLCPYKKVFYNMVSRISEKCIGCFPLEQGEVALCVESCIGKIRLHGFLSTREEPRADNPLDYIIKIRKIALPLYPQLLQDRTPSTTSPVQCRRSFTGQLFGPGVEEAKDMCRNLDRDPQLLGALTSSPAASATRIITRFAVETETVLGWLG
ncbi:MAG: 4Fe-4S dicluster domain-containing protein [Candidatus Eisenbacteria bacterium]